MRNKPERASIICQYLLTSKPYPTRSRKRKNRSPGPCGRCEVFDLDQLPTPRKAIGWEYDAETLGFMASVVENLEPQRILEFGSGISTLLFAQETARLPKPCQIISMDHDPRCLKYIGEQLASNEQDVHVSLLLAPLVARKFVDRELPAYHFPKDEALGQSAADLIIVAGPPAMLTNREGILYQIMDLARPGTLIVLPDADRLEKEALARWRN